MTKNLLILRASPDWHAFDIARSRDFLRPFGLPENLIVEFAALWSRYFSVDYCSVRARLKTLALETYNDVRQASLLRHEEWDGRGDPGGWIAFVDDDDWMSPDLFESLPAATSGDDGVRWGSMRVGRRFASNGYGEPIIQRRPLDSIVYTNNYAVTVGGLDRHGRAAFFEHDAAQRTFDQAGFGLVTSGNYLSCAVKHPCCTMSVNYLMSLESFRSDPRREMSDFMNALDAMRPDDMHEWIRMPFARFREIMADAIRPRC
ncbi:MAG TPA: hypothetical protein VEK73_02270 [Xanthobacteraceae bacterium]|nr:hypothetical protein [Xanthobacteraceae bacterium]